MAAPSHSPFVHWQLTALAFMFTPASGFAFTYLATLLNGFWWAFESLILFKIRDAPTLGASVICVSREHQKCFCIKLNDNKIIRMRGERKVDECGRLAKQHIFKLANENAKNDSPAVGDSRIAGRSHHTHTSTRWHLERPCQPKIVKTQTKWMRTLPSRGNSI